MCNLLEKRVLEVLKDVRRELDEPEVAELTSLALDRKVDDLIAELEKRIGE